VLSFGLPTERLLVDEKRDVVFGLRTRVVWFADGYLRGSASPMTTSRKNGLVFQDPTTDVTKYKSTRKKWRKMGEVNFVIIKGVLHDPDSSHVGSSEDSLTWFCG
jgi:hypothetical protein